MTNFLERGARNLICWWKTGYVCAPAAVETYDPEDEAVSDDPDVSPEDLNGGGDTTYGQHATAPSHPAVPGAPARMDHGVHTELELQRLKEAYPPPKTHRPGRPGRPGPRGRFFR